jgi:hypothetical protein
MKIPKLSVAQMMGIAGLIGNLVHKVQELHGDKTGEEKHAIVKDLAIQSLPIIEGLSGLDLNDPLIIEAIDACIAAE